MWTLLRLLLRIHGLRILLTLAWVGLCLADLLVFGLERQSISWRPMLAQVGTMAVPGLAIWWAHLIFVRPHGDRSAAVVLELPVSARAWAAAQLGFGTLAVALPLGGGLALALVASRGRELVPDEVLRASVIDIAVHGAGWFAIGALFAQLGRYRNLAWVTLTCFFLSASQLRPEIYEAVKILEPIAQTPTETVSPSTWRLLVLYPLVVLAAVWIAGKDGGAWTARQYGALSGWARSWNAAAATSMVLVVGLLADAIEWWPSSETAEALALPGLYQLGPAEPWMDEALEQVKALDALAGGEHWRPDSTVLWSPPSFQLEFNGPRVQLGGGSAFRVPLILLSRERMGPTEWLVPGLALAQTSTRTPALPREVRLEERHWREPSTFALAYGGEVYLSVAAEIARVALEQCPEAVKRSFDPSPQGESGVRRAWRRLRGDPGWLACDTARMQATLRRRLDATRLDVPLPEGTVVSRGDALLVSSNHADALLWTELSPLQPLRPHRLSVHRIPLTEGRIFRPVPADRRLAVTLARQDQKTGLQLISGWQEVR